MKNIYIMPITRVAEIESDALIATSPRIAGGPSAAQKRITDDDIDAFEMDVKEQNTGSAWDNEW